MSAKNKFEIIDYSAVRVLDLRMSEDTSDLENLSDDDVLVRVIGRCIDGPEIGYKASHFSVVTAELYADPKCRAVIEQDAHSAWSRLESPRKMGKVKA